MSQLFAKECDTSTDSSTRSHFWKTYEREQVTVSLQGCQMPKDLLKARKNTEPSKYRRVPYLVRDEWLSAVQGYDSNNLRCGLNSSDLSPSTLA